MEKPLQQDLYATLQKALSDGASEGELVYRTLAEAIGEEIAKGRLRAGGRLPSERMLASELGLARGTIRQAIEELVDLRLLTRKRGSGTQVTHRMEKSLTKLSGFSEEMRQRGMTPGARWLEREKTLPSLAEAAGLAIPEDAQVLRLKRLRLADGMPIAIEVSVVPANLLPSADLVGDSLYDALRAQNAAPVKGTQRIRAGIMSVDEAALMETRPGTQMLIVERRCELADGRPVELTETRYNGLVYHFATSLQA